MAYYNNQGGQQPPINTGYYQPQNYNPYPPGGYPQQYPQQPAPQGYPPNATNIHFAEGGVPKHEMGFSDISIRAAFIRKVFTMVAIMLAVVTFMSAVPFFHEPTMRVVQQSYGLYLLGYVSFLVVYIALICCESVRRSFPANIICTAILTLSIGFMTMMITSRHSLQSVTLCLLITTICCFGIIVFACQTKYDITSCAGYLVIASLVLMVFGFVAIIALSFFHVKFLYLIYAGLSALMFMFYLAFDIQTIMGGRKYEVSPEDHIFASIQIFLDIIFIFWFLLSLFGDSN